MKQTVNILGTEYELIGRDYADDPEFDRKSWCGYCDYIAKKIVSCNMKTWPGYEFKTEDEIIACEKWNKRHEIVHAFLDESGLSDSATKYGGAWSKNEEMVDWFAMQGEKIYKAWQESNCL